MKLYNTLTRKKQEFKPIVPGEIKMYACGPTVYNYFHIGNARTFMIFDAMRRYFEYRGYKVTFVQNFTDIDDKILKRAKEEQIAPNEISEKYIKAYFEDAESLGIQKADFHPKVTENIPEIIEFIEKLMEKGAAYQEKGDVYFNIDYLQDYGKLSKQNLEDLQAGARIELNEQKKNPLDFVLWKEAKEGEISWDSPWGQGRPGWHIECSAMAKKYLGETIDIHGGGGDLIFPHHENEIAQSEACIEKPFANYWLHVGYLNIDYKKMSKSLNNFFTLREISVEFDLEILRFFILSSHYRNPINFSKDQMEASKSALERIYTAKSNLEHIMETAKDIQSTESEVKWIEEISNYKNKFIEAMDDDFNTADGIAVIFDLVRNINTNASKYNSYNTIKKAHELLMELTDVLGLLNKKQENALLGEEVKVLIEKRQQARKDKNFKLADQIRDELKEKGIILEDTPQGVRWSRIDD